jgi:transketolase
MEFIGMQDRFGESGTPAELMEHFGLTARHIAESVKKAVARKQEKSP